MAALHPQIHLIVGINLLGACVALGQDDTVGHLTIARPARLGVVQTTNGDGAEGDGLRREWFNAAIHTLMEHHTTQEEADQDGVDNVEHSTVVVVVVVVVVVLVVV